jgi:hypothetical protein
LPSNSVSSLTYYQSAIYRWTSPASKWPSRRIAGRPLRYRKRPRRSVARYEPGRD